MIKNPSRNILYLIFSILAYLLFVVWAGYYFYSCSKEQIMSEIDDKLFIAASSLKYMLAPDFHDRATSPDSISWEEELRNRATVSEFALNSEFIYLYTLIKSEGGFYFAAPTVTEEEAKERKRWYFYPYEDVPEGFRRAFENEETVYIQYEDQWGKFRSIALPQRSPGGRLYLSCADYKISFVEDLLISGTMKSIWVSGSFIIPLIIFLLTFRKIYTDQYAHLKQEMAERKNLDIKLHDLLDQTELLVEERTTDLKKANEELHVQIEEHKRTQSALKESESRIRLITDSLPVMISFVDHELRYRFVNREYEVWFNQPRDEIIGQRVSDVLGEDVFQTMKPKILAALSGEIVRYEIRLPGHDGGFRNYFTRNIPYRDEAGAVVGYFVLAEDITEQKKAEEALREKEARYRTVVEESFDGLVLHDGKCIVFNNHGAERLLGYESGELIGLNFKKLCSPESYELMYRRAQIRLRGEMVTSRYEVRLIRKDGKSFDAEVSERRVIVNNEPFIQTWFRDISEHKQAEEAMDFERRQLLSIFNSLNEIIYVSDPFTYEMIFANQRLKDLTGREPGDAFCYEYLQHRDRPCDFCTNGIILNNHGKPHKWEYRNPVTDIYVSIVDQIIRWPDGRDVRLEIAVDITEKKLAEESLRASEIKLRSIFEAMTDLIIILDSEGRYMEIAPTNTDLLYLPADELLGKTLEDVFPPEQAKEFRRAISSTLSRGKQVSLDYELTINNQKVWFVGTISPLSSDRVIWVARDITNRKRAEEALREREEKYRLLANNITDNIWVLDLDSLRFSYVSPSVVNISGYTADEVIEFQLNDTLTPSAYELAMNKMKEELAKDHIADPSRSVTLELEQFHKDGSTIWTEVSMSFIRDQEGRPTAISGVTRDITERRKLQTQLQQAQKMETIGTLAGGIAHDFNNILQAVMGYSELARQKINAGKNALHEVDVVIQAGTRASELVHHILSFSRKNEPERKALNMNLIVKEALQLLRASLPATIEIRLETDDTCGCVFADPTQMHQVIMNLCTNAAHAMKAFGGVLEVKLETVSIDQVLASKNQELHPGRYQRLSVSDTGHGMDQATLTRIFDPFFTTKKPGEGTGMGMSVAHGIIKNHMGAITVYSELGVGSKFQVYLPLSYSDGMESVPDSEKPTPKTGTEHILYVDDEKILVDLAKETLTSLGYQVTSRTSSLEALELFRKFPYSFDLIITDQTMPQLTGIDLAKEAMKTRADIPVILCTGFSASITPESASAAGIRELVMKPLLTGEIAKTIRNVLDREIHKEENTTPETGALIPSRSLKILVADDEVTSRCLAAAFLENAGHTVVTVDNGRKALTILDQEGFDLIVMDCKMPEMSGIQTTMAIRSKEKAIGGHTPILAMTGGDDRDIQRFLDAGADGFLSKPITSQILLGTIEDLVTPSNR